MIGVREKEMIEDDLFRDVFRSLVLQKDNILSNLKIFDKLYSYHLSIPSCEVERKQGTYKLEDNKIFINSSYLENYDNYNVLIAYFYQKRIHMQNYAIKNNKKFLEESIFDFELLSIKGKRTPLSDKSYEYFCETDCYEYLSPWACDAAYFSKKKIVQLIDAYLEYNLQNNISIRGETLALEKLKNNALKNIDNYKSIDINYIMAIDAFEKEYDSEINYINKIREFLYNGAVDVEIMIIAKKAEEFLDAYESGMLASSYNETAVKRYIKCNNLQDKSIEEICEFILSKNSNKR